MSAAFQRIVNAISGADRCGYIRTRVDVADLGALVDEISDLRQRLKLSNDTLFQFRDMLTAVHDGLEDEGDRVYLESTNHAELIHEAWHAADSLKWDTILELNDEDREEQEREDMRQDLRDEEDA